MSVTITVRLSPELAEWLRDTAKKTGLPAGRIVREKLEQAAHEDRPYMKLAGKITGPRNLSQRKGFSKS